MSITNVITRITVDMAGDVKRFAVKAKQYDRATRVIVVSLLWDEVPYVLDSADAVRCNVHKPDGTIAIIEGDNIAVSGNTVTITLPGTALTAAGRAWADIEIETQDESQQVSCQCFEIDIAKSPVDDDSIISTNEFSAMKLATKAANDAAAAATAEIEATEAAGTAASQAAAAAQAATDAANQAAAAATASVQIDATLTDNSKAAPAGMVGQIKEDLSEYNAYEILHKVGTFNNGTTRGVTYTWNSDKTKCTVSGTAEGTSANSIYSAFDLPPGTEAGRTYHVLFTTTNNNILLEIIAYLNGATSGGRSTFIYSNESVQEYSIPAECTGMTIRLRVINGSVGDGTVEKIAILTALTNNQITDMLDKVIAPIETGTTASQAYAVGKYFILNHQFCKAKTAIASGAKFTLNTNYEVTTVADELYAALHA